MRRWASTIGGVLVAGILQHLADSHFHHTTPLASPNKPRINAIVSARSDYLREGPAVIDRNPPSLLIHNVSLVAR